MLGVQGLWRSSCAWSAVVAGRGGGEEAELFNTPPLRRSSRSSPRTGSSAVWSRSLRPGSAACGEPVPQIMEYVGRFISCGSVSRSWCGSTTDHGVLGVMQLERGGAEQIGVCQWIIEYVVVIQLVRGAGEQIVAWCH